jgi:hypothetical protein
VNRSVPVIRRRAAACAAAIVVALTITSGCADVANRDVVARVGDAELTEAELRRITPTTPGAADSGALASETARGTIAQWVQNRMFSDLLGEGAPLASTADAEGFANSSQALLESYLAAYQPADSEARSLYGQGIAASGIACVAHILVATEAEAEQVLERLDDGDSFAAVAADTSTDPGSAANGGAYPCESAETFASTYVPEYVEGALSAEVGVPTQPVRSDFGYHVMLVRPYDEVSAEVRETATDGDRALADFRAAVASADISVSSRYGLWSPDELIVRPISG